MVSYSVLDLLVYLLIYSFLGWVIEVCIAAIAERRFSNRGFFNLPLIISYGVIFDLLILVLPSAAGNYVIQFIITLVVISVVEAFAGMLVKRLSKGVIRRQEPDRMLSGNKKGFFLSAFFAAMYYLTYLVFHPILVGVVCMIPAFVSLIAVSVAGVMLLADFLTVFITVKGAHEIQKKQKDNVEKLGNRISETVWKRLKKAYPDSGITDEGEAESPVFAKGFCMDKMVWIFLVCALCGDLIETVFCRFTMGRWMSRSSVLYGPFSIVWGLGAALLTVVLQRLAGKQDRHVFAAGFVIGGVYEYMCSVFTELVFGTVFWDYSKIPFNINGRTNILYCFFWGVIAVIWIKIVYPPLSSAIERTPPIAGKVITWLAILFMVCNGLLTTIVMMRYSGRQEGIEAKNAVEQLIDMQYNDELVENRWPNMIRKDKTRQ